MNAKPLDFALWINLRKELANTFSNTLIEAEDENLSVKAPISILDIEPSYIAYFGEITDFQFEFADPKAISSTDND